MTTSITILSHIQDRTKATRATSPGVDRPACRPHGASQKRRLLDARRGASRAGGKRCQGEATFSQEVVFNSSLDRRIDRLETIEAIRQLECGVPMSHSWTILGPNASYFTPFGAPQDAHRSREVRKAPKPCAGLRLLARSAGPYPPMPDLRGGLLRSKTASEPHPMHPIYSASFAAALYPHQPKSNRDCGASADGTSRASAGPDGPAEAAC
jgi:hypothetical protein